jgi:hypothetical protein
MEKSTIIVLNLNKKNIYHHIFVFAFLNSFLIIFKGILEKYLWRFEDTGKS